MGKGFLAARLAAFCESVYGTEFSLGINHMHILYLEGCTAQTLEPNPDAADKFNDARIILRFSEAGVAEIVFAAPATSEPGLSATHDLKSARLGGVARIAIGFHKEKWKMGYHKSTNHPALVQCAPITVHRDANKDGKRTGDPVTVDVVGLNQHGTRPGIPPTIVGGYSYGCLVGQDWIQHISFITLLKQDPRYIADGLFKFSTTVVDYGKFWAFAKEGLQA